MSKFFNNFFGNKSTFATSTASKSPTAKANQNCIANGKLETDAVQVDDDAANCNLSLSSIATHTASSEMTADVVRELSDPNYNSSAAMMEISEVVGNSNPNAMAANGVFDNAAVALGASNTMNVNNAQQQLVMQFSNASNLHFGSVYNFNSPLSNSSAGDSRKNSCADDGGIIGLDAKRQTSTTRKTTSIVLMMQSQEEPHHRILDTIATHLGEGWKLVMRNLGHSEGQIEQALIDHQMHGGIKEVIYQLLLQWIRTAEDGEATIGRITSLLWEMNHRECVVRMKSVWKSNSLRKSSSR